MNYKNILFVCSANKHRSKTAEDYFSNLNLAMNFKSAGTNQKMCQKEKTQFLNEKLMNWADLVLVMEIKHENLINKATLNLFQNKIKILDIPDDFQYFQKELIEILKEKVEKYIKKD